MTISDHILGDLINAATTANDPCQDSEDRCEALVRLYQWINAENVGDLLIAYGVQQADIERRREIHKYVSEQLEEQQKENDRFIEWAWVHIATNCMCCPQYGYHDCEQRGPSCVLVYAKACKGCGGSGTVAPGSECDTCAGVGAEEEEIEG